MSVAGHDGDRPELMLDGSREGFGWLAGCTLGLD